MMYAKMVNIGKGYYSCRESNSDELRILSNFLTDDVLTDSGIDFFKRWLACKDAYTAEGNISYLKKLDNNMLELTTIFEDDPSFFIGCAQFSNLLDIWPEILILKPYEILISVSENQLTIVGKNSIDQQICAKNLGLHNH